MPQFLPLSHFAGTSGPLGTPTTPPVNTITNDPLLMDAYVRPDNLAAIDEQALTAAGDTANAALMHKMAIQPTPFWLGGYSDESVRLPEYMNNATSAGKAMQFVVYYGMYRDNAQYSGGGALGLQAYKDKIDYWCQQLGSVPAIMLIEPDLLSFSGPPGTATNDSTTGITYTPMQARLLAVQYATTKFKALDNKRVYVDVGTKGFSGWPSSHWQRVAPRYWDVAHGIADGYAINTSNYNLNSECIEHAQLMNAYMASPSGTSVITGETRTALTPQRFIICSDRNGVGGATSTPTTVNGYTWAKGADSRDGWCNVPNRALGTRPGTAPATAFASITNTTIRTYGDTYCDYLGWFHTPYTSDGKWNPRSQSEADPIDYNTGRAPNAGALYRQYALDLAAHPSSGS